MGRNINNLRYADDTTLTAESEEELKSLLMKVKVETARSFWDSSDLPVPAAVCASSQGGDVQAAARGGSPITHQKNTTSDPAEMLGRGGQVP